MDKNDKSDLQDKPMGRGRGRQSCQEDIGQVPDTWVKQ